MKFTLTYVSGHSYWLLLESLVSFIVEHLQGSYSLLYISLSLLLSAPLDLIADAKGRFS